ncbi:MAG: phosphatidylserine decarboxylase [Thermoplasmatales archaeon]|nr:phosphatidylserine decarboxylase [Thermoplasmatales archaeon]
MIAKGTAHLILAPLILGIACLLLFWYIKPIIFLSSIFFIITIFFLFFFRDPKRIIGDGVVAPADGKIMRIEENDSIKVSTFMNLHNVHVNRAPLDGKIISIEHVSGRHAPAYKKESDSNEKVVIEMDTETGSVKIVQIAGIFARRIVPYIKKGDAVKKGQRIGIIRFGSRVDCYLPKNVEIMVKEGGNVLAGKTSIGMIK